MNLSKRMKSLSEIVDRDKFFGSIPNLIAASIDSSNLAFAVFLTSSNLALLWQVFTNGPQNSKMTLPLTLVG